MREAQVVDAFEAWLLSAGWRVQREVDHVDLLADHPDGRRLYVEAKGHTSSPGLDVDTLYGQLLRRMRPDEPQVGYAVVVPETVLGAALRVPSEVRRRLRVDVYAVDETGRVRAIG